MSVERIRHTSDAWASLEDAKRWTRVSHDDEDPDFTRMIDAVAIEAEEYAQIALLNQTIRILLPRWPRGHVPLPIGPLLDRSSVSVTIDTVPWPDVLIDGGSRPLLVICGNPPPGVVVIEYEAGFGPLPADIPADIRQAMLDQVAAYFDARGTGDPQTISLSPQFARILGRYRGVRA